MSETPERLGAAAPAVPEKPERPLDEIAAERAADLAEVEDRQREAVSFDDRCAAIGECLMDLYAAGGEIADDLEPYVDEGQFPDIAARALAQYEAGKRERRPDYDITSKPPKFIKLALGKALERAEQREEASAVTAPDATPVTAETVQAEAEIIADVEEEADEAEINGVTADIVEAEAADAVTEKSSLIEFRESNLDLKGVDFLEGVIASAEVLPEQEVERARAFLRIRALAQTEEDAALITQRIEAQDFSQGVPDPGAFIRTEIFSSSAHDTGFSEAMQEAVAKEFDLERPPKADTGSQVRELATATTPDPETGEPVPAYTEERPAEFRPGVGAWSSDGEDVHLTVTIPGHPPVSREVTGWSNDDIGLLAEAMGFAAGMEHYGATGFVEDVYKIDFSVLGESAFDRDSLRQIRQMISAMVGGFEGYDGDIFDVRDKVGLLQHQARLLNPEDTATGFENDRETTRAAARKLGLRDADDRINLDVLKAFGRYSQETYLSGDPGHADLHAYLYRQFPEFVEPPQGDAQAA